ncbi:MAG: HD domain-containing protein [Eubacteriales bacterium]|nr:HD domain-containing protein [Eubacteriales bacterium]
MALDYLEAQRAFEEYLEEYDRQDEKIRLKIVHTYGVVACAGEIGKRMGLSREDGCLGKIIALLHDIGRFEQIRRFDSFLPDTMDHAAYGAALLFGDMAAVYGAGEKGMEVLCREPPMIRRFVREREYDRIICQAIAFHSHLALPPITDPGALLHARLIRDADKLDNCRVKLQERIETMLGMSVQEAGRGKISPQVWEACQRETSVLSAHRRTGVDYWVSYIAQYYDVNFPQTWEIIREEDYIRRIAERLQYEDPDTREKIERLIQGVESRMEREIWKNR